MIDNSQYIMKYDAYTGNNTDISKYISTVKYSLNTINNISFDNMKSIFKDYFNLYENIDKTADVLFNDKIDGIKYFQNENIIVIPTAIYKVIDADSSIDYQCLMSFYNLKGDNIWGFEIPITLKNLPSFTATRLATVEQKYKSDMNCCILFDNLPASLYDNVVIEEQGIMYDIDKNKYFTQAMNQKELFERIEKVAENGFEKPLEMLISSEGLIPLNESKVDFIISLYLNLPNIPVAIISSQEINNSFIKRFENRNDTNYSSYVIKHIDNKFNKEELQKFVEPYFIFN